MAEGNVWQLSRSSRTLTTVCLTLALTVAPASGGQTAPAQAERHITVIARDLHFEPDVIEAPPDTDLVVTLVNEGLEPHDIAFYEEEGGAPIGPGSVGPVIGGGESAEMRFTTPGPGRHPFLCVVHPLEMQGTLIVGGGAAVPDRAAPGGLSALPLGQHPDIAAAAFRVTTYAQGLPYTSSMQLLPDGDLLVAVNETDKGGFLASTGRLLRLADIDADGVADEATPVTIALPDAVGDAPASSDAFGAIIQMRLHDDLLVMTTRTRQRAYVVVIRPRWSEGEAWPVLGSVELRYPKEQLHLSYALALREGPDPYDVEVYFNVGSRFNAKNDTTRVKAVGLIDAELVPESIYRFVLHDDGTTVVASDLRLMAVGLRNAAALAFHPVTGDLWLQDNGIDGEDDPDEPLSADELNVIPADRLGREVVDFGFATTYVAYRSGALVGDRGEPPAFVFQPIDGSEAEGPMELAFAPPTFPDGLDGGLFVGFHGRRVTGGLANEENPLRYVDLTAGTSIDFIPNDAPDVGHLDFLLATHDSLFIADLNRFGSMGTGDAEGVIYQVKAVSGGG